MPFEDCSIAGWQEQDALCPYLASQGTARSLLVGGYVILAEFISLKMKGL
jgi:hypothetical protein